MEKFNEVKNCLVQALKAQLGREGISIDPSLIQGNFDRNGAQWCMSFIKLVNNKSVLLACYGDFSRNLSKKWISSKGLSKEDAKHLEVETQKFFEEIRRKKEAEELVVAEEVRRKWDSYATTGTTPYLQRKKIDSLFCSRIESTSNGERVLIVPLVDMSGALWSTQRIFPDGTKRFPAGSRTKGLFCKVRGNFLSVVYICEGFATGASVALAVDNSATVICALSAGNMPEVANAVREIYPEVVIVIVADNDTKKIDAGNPGLKFGQDAVNLVGGKLVYPRFDSIVGGEIGSDMNDVHVTLGLDEVKRQLAEQERQVPFESGTFDPKRPLPEKQVAEMLLAELNPNIIRQDQNLFRFSGTHWIEMNDGEIDRLKNRLNALCDNKLSSRLVDSHFKTFMRYVPSVPDGVNMYASRSDCANFEDGTLFLVRDKESGAYSTQFRNHQRADYLTWCVPVRYSVDRSIKNDRFNQLLEEAFFGDKHKEEKIQAIKEIAGAMLIPSFPQLVFFHGKSGSRKSTVARTLLKLISSENVSRNDPSDMDGFEREAMIGKLVNANLELRDNYPIPREFFKGLEDNAPMMVNRKNKTVVNALLPRVHLYCANVLPPNLEKDGRAMERRVRLVEFTRDLTNGPGSKPILDYCDLVFNSSPEGILNFMLEGLESLVSNGGKFSELRSSASALASWQLESDPIGMYLEELKSGYGNAECTVKLQPDGSSKVLRRTLFEVFVDWCKWANVNHNHIHARAFYKSLRDRGHQEYDSHGGPAFRGFVLVEGNPGPASTAEVSP